MNVNTTQQFFDKISSGEIDPLSKNWKAFLANYLKDAGFGEAEIEKWIKLLTQYWMANSMSKLSEMLDEGEVEALEDVFNSSGQDGVNTYVIKMKDERKDMYDKVVTIFKDEFISSLQHFLKTTNHK